ncbi:MAG: hypothetical protein A3A33_00140 [Candidatus Yanofskybacteria bacterium RIFCSPLOWO2_01_FULL_49_25]|uniref:Uncharacterized protein n=1 Tax=Candidatus Yanofskybacteria bacterium RIFCSPLOWO2_01_FULL_49_25 TaxID=1802701 RepID=A0A1F8GUF9_9BACT|nr:MAG: hypothetical protein A3A33_00140 [Candidatus Yanofskybacteria bacterium RIFCSPLOWO2_01_FULL_49_25]
MENRYLQRGFVGGWLEGILLVVAILIIAGYYYSKYPEQGKKFFASFKTTPSVSASPTPSMTPSATDVARLMTACQAIPNGQSAVVSPRSQIFINLPNDIYPESGFTFATSGTASAVTAVTGPNFYRSTDYARNHCWGHYYELAGRGTVTFSAVSIYPSVSRYQITFKVQ